jgi:hypothetical protein
VVLHHKVTQVEQLVMAIMVVEIQVDGVRLIMQQLVAVEQEQQDKPLFHQQLQEQVE